MNLLLKIVGWLMSNPFGFERVELLSALIFLTVAVGSAIVALSVLSERLPWRLIVSGYFDSSIVYVKPLELSIERLEVPYEATVIASQSTPMVRLSTCLPSVQAYCFKNLAARKILTLIASDSSNAEFFSVLADDPTFLEAFDIPYIDAAAYIPISPLSRAASVKSQSRESSDPSIPYIPLTLVVSNKGTSALYVLIHAVEGESPYIIAQFYRSPGHRTYRLQNIYSDALNSDCSVCLSVAAVVVLLPCRHKCVCRSCAMKLSDCPICRTVIVTYFNTSISSNGQQDN